MDTAYYFEIMTDNGFSLLIYSHLVNAAGRILYKIGCLKYRRLTYSQFPCSEMPSTSAIELVNSPIGMSLLPLKALRGIG